MIISTMRQHHRVRVGLPNPRHRIGTDRPDGRYVGSFDGNDEKNCPGNRCGARWRATRILVLLRARCAEKRSGTGPTSRQLQEKVGGVARQPFLAGRSRNWRCIGFDWRLIANAWHAFTSNSERPRATLAG